MVAIIKTDTTIENIVFSFLIFRLCAKNQPRFKYNNLLLDQEDVCFESEPGLGQAILNTWVEQCPHDLLTSYTILPALRD